MMTEPILLSWSGGKDSAMALYALRASERYRVAALLTTVTEGYDRVSMHGVRRALLEQQAASLGLPLEVVAIPQQCSNETYEARMRAAMLAFRAAGIRTVAFGDIFLEDLRRYRETHLAEAEMEAVFPIWKRDTRELVRTFAILGFRAVVACVDTKVLDPSFAGRLIDAEFLEQLPAGADPCGENSEFHSFVFAGPLFREPVRFSLGEAVTRDGFCFRDLLPVPGA